MKISHECFTKIRVGRKRNETELGQKMKIRDQLKAWINSTTSVNNKIVLQKELLGVESDISEMCAQQNVEKIRDQIGNLSNLKGGFSGIGMWKLKKKLLPPSRDPPMAKRDASGNIITAPEALKKLYLETYVHRLRHRPIMPGLEALKQLKEDLWERRLKILKQNKTPEWKSEEVKKILDSLKDNKARDPSGLINELFKEGVAGPDLVEAVKQLVNRIKHESTSVPLLDLANITTIYKNKGSRLDLVNDRGIFGLSIFRLILEKLIYNDKFETLDRGMSDSNVGGRRGRNITVSYTHLTLPTNREV